MPSNFKQIYLYLISIIEVCTSSAKHLSFCWPRHFHFSVAWNVPTLWRRFYDEIVSAILCTSCSSKLKKSKLLMKFSLFCNFYVVFKIQQNYYFRVNIVILAPKIIFDCFGNIRWGTFLYSKTTNFMCFVSFLTQPEIKKRFDVIRRSLFFLKFKN